MTDSFQQLCTLKEHLVACFKAAVRIGLFQSVDIEECDGECSGSSRDLLVECLYGFFVGSLVLHAGGCIGIRFAFYIFQVFPQLCVYVFNVAAQFFKLVRRGCMLRFGGRKRFQQSAFGIRQHIELFD